MTLIWDYTLNWIKPRKILLSKKYTKSSIFLGTPWTVTDNIKKHNIFLNYYLGDYSLGYRENCIDVKF